MRTQKYNTRYLLFLLASPVIALLAVIVAPWLDYLFADVPHMRAERKIDKYLRELVRHE